MALLLLLPGGVSAGEQGKTAAPSKSQSLIGAWECTGDEGPSRLVFESENRLIYKGEPSAYMLSPGVILVQEDFLPVSYPYTLAGDSLVITFPEGNQVRCRRAGAHGTSGEPRKAEETQRAGKPERVSPHATGGGGEQFLKGGFCSHSSMTSRRYNFDGAGGFSFGSESTGTWQSKDQYGDVDGSYLFSAGNQYNPRSRGRYSISGDRVTLTWGNGNREVYRVNMRQKDGRITELQGEGSDSFIATGLCEENLYR
jgi:hypothetical protein